MDVFVFNIWSIIRVQDLGQDKRENNKAWVIYQFTSDFSIFLLELLNTLLMLSIFYKFHVTTEKLVKFIESRENSIDFDRSGSGDSKN
jgi:uncharacterized membrane protein